LRRQAGEPAVEHKVFSPKRTELALSAAEVRRICAAGKIAVVHTVEGGHVLEGKLENLDKLAQRGVAMLTLCHFYENGLAAQVVGIPKDYAIAKFFRLKFGAYGRPALGDLGRAVVRRLQELKMLVDVTHCTPEARAAVYAELNAQRPIIASHSGVTKLNPDADPPDEVSDSSQMGNFTKMLLEHGLDETAIKKILGGNAQRILEEGWR
jgi:microsomal dipeptidase-like Zn-dependent dipeptidase